MGRRFYHWWFRRWSRRATYPRAVLHALMAAVYVTLAFYALRKNDETLGWLGVGGSVIFIARAAADFSYRRRHQPPPKARWLDDALG